MSSAAPGTETVTPDLQRVSIVVPVYQGERTLEPLLAEIEPLTAPGATPRGRRFHVAEVILVHDGAIDDSHTVMESLAARLPFVTNVWLSRNFGQHPATLAGMAATSADWVVTLDEDGQQNPADIGGLLDAALEVDAPLVYGQALNPPPHGLVRNTLSRLAKALSVAIVGNRQMAHFNSYRLVRGDIAQEPGGLLRPRRVPRRRARLGGRPVGHRSRDAPPRPAFPPVRLHVPQAVRALRTADPDRGHAAAPADLRRGLPGRPRSGRA